MDFERNEKQDVFTLSNPTKDETNNFETASK